MIAIFLVEAFIWRTFSGDAELTNAFEGQFIYAYHATQGTPRPFILYNFQAGRVIHGNGMVRLYEELVYQVKVIAELDDARLLNAPRVRAAAHRMDDLLSFHGGRSFQLDEWRCYITVRLDREIALPLEQGEVPSIAYKHIGGLYRFQVMNVRKVA